MRAPGSPALYVPITYSIDRARRRILAVVEGSVTCAEIMDHLERERDDGGLPLPELGDATRATVALSPEEVGRVVSRLRELGRDHALGATAVVVGDDLSFGVLRMLEALVADVCDVRPFRGRGEAERWVDSNPFPRPPSQRE